MELLFSEQKICIKKMLWTAQRAMRACVPTWSTCQRACVPKYQKRANFSFIRAKVIRRAIVLSWRANVPKGVPIFLLFFLWNAKENFYILLLYKKFYILLDMVVTHMICICIVNKNCIILYFYTHVMLKKRVWNFSFFIIFFSFLLFS